MFKIDIDSGVSFFLVFPLISDLAEAFLELLHVDIFSIFRSISLVIYNV